MKPADLFIGVRQFFGALIPGCIWTIAVLIPAYNAGLSNLLDLIANKGNTAATIVFLAVSFLAGLVLQPISFRAAVFLGSFRMFSICGWESDSWNLDYAKRVRQSARTIMATRLNSIAGVITGGASNKASCDQSESREEILIFEYCKKFVIDRSAQLGKKLEERESEINLVATLPLPLLSLTPALFMTTHRFSGLSWATTFLVLTLAIVVLLLWQLRQMCQAERRECLEMFLMLDSSSRWDSTSRTGSTETEGNVFANAAFSLNYFVDSDAP